MSTSIRLLTVEDAVEFKAFRLKSLRDAPDAFHSLPEEWDHPIAEIEKRIEKNRIFGAFTADNALVGIAMLALTARPIKQMRHKCEIWAVFVDETARGQGLARRLVERCIAEAKALGYEAAILTASTHLTHVVKLYQSLGFVIYGTERGMVKLLDGRVIDDHLMELRLD
ncbi:MAG: GNAT family N-acetyltransferase [Beijerinckiaceae bacterium]